MAVTRRVTAHVNCREDCECKESSVSAYPVGHLKAQGIMLGLVSLGEDIVSVRIEAHGIIPVSAAIWRPDSANPTEGFRIVRYQIGGSDSHQRAWSDTNPSA